MPAAPAGRGEGSLKAAAAKKTRPAGGGSGALKARLKKLLSALAAEGSDKPPGKARGEQPYAAFDADGTLWPEDVNHILIKYQQRQGLREVSDLLKNNLWQGRRAEKCAEFARRQQDLSPGSLRVFCRAALGECPPRPFPLMAWLLRLLRENGLMIYVVSASLEPLVEEALKGAGLAADRVLGAKCRVAGGGITSHVIQPLTYGPGKKQALLQITGGRRPWLAAGNSLSDLPLLELAEAPVAVRSAPAGHENFDSERELAALAKQRGWLAFEA